MNKLSKISNIQGKIIELRGQKIILDKDLANLYGVETRYLNKQIDRNLERFPEDFMFQLSRSEFQSLMFQFGTSKRGGTRKLPYAFTRNGANMVATILRSKTAVGRSIFIMRAFSALEEAIGKRKSNIISSPDVIKELSIHSRAIMKLFQEIKYKDKQMDNVERLQKEMTRLIQKIIIASIGGVGDKG